MLQIADKNACIDYIKMGAVMKKLTIAQILYSLVGVMLTLLAIIGVLGLGAAKTANDGLDTVYKDRVVPLEQLKVIADMYAVNIVDTSHKARNGNINWETARKNVAEATKTIDSKWKEYLSTTLVADEQKLVNELKPLMSKADGSVKKLEEILKEQQQEKLAEFTIKEMYPVIDPVSDKISELVNVQLKVAKQEYTSSHATYVSRKLIGISIFVVAAISVSILAFIIIRSVTGQLGGEPHQVREIAHRVSTGDLTVTFDHVTFGDTSIMAAVEEMVNSLRGLVSQVLSASQNIAAASNQLHSTAEQIATGAEELSSQVTTVATASEEMAATSTSIADSCHHAAAEASMASTAAITGSGVVSSTISGMERIAERVRGSAETVGSLGARSDQIGAIIATIEDIADQTNLLALNAAIEAARAGEMGRGFAVVADEVRALAERTTRATREIGEMIKNIQAETRTAVTEMDLGVKEVQQGTDDAAQSGEALQEILAKINELTMEVNQIATAAEEQAATTSEITTNLQQVTDIVHTSSRGAEETASAAAQLSRQAEDLKGLMQRFRL
jgi:methyl-accepting chemotaxis protein